VGRNFDEVLRAIDALQVSEAKNVVTPANWKPGDAVLVPPNISTQEANKMFTEGVRQEKLEYMRFTACPKLTKAERVRSQATAGTTGTMASKQTAV
jgi:PhoPQ-activated pathogenicity-related protein